MKFHRKDNYFSLTQLGNAASCQQQSLWQTLVRSERCRSKIVNGEAAQQIWIGNASLGFLGTRLKLELR